ncbi:iron ABC transporter permease [Micromonospora sp. NPDC005206]|uniref:ABC transporter permease n=1 Tax=Micromonospora sp. NPDC005206 TaxID=3157022 RepID=UPI0033BF301F
MKLETIEAEAGDIPAPARNEDIPTSRSSRWVKRARLPAGLIALLAILIVVPILLVVVSSLTTETPRPGNLLGSGLTLENFATILSAGTRQALLNSLIVGVGASILALFIGGLLAFTVARTNVPGRRFLYLVGLVPMFLPSYVGALAWAILGNPNAGLANIGLKDIGLPALVNIYNLGGLIFVLGIYYAPYSFLLIHSAFSLMNPDLEESAAIHGAGTFRVLRKVTLPLATPAILGSLVLTLVLTLENFPVAQIIGGAAHIDTLPTYIYRLMNSSPSRGNEGAAVAIALVALILVITAIQRKVISSRDFTTVAGKGIKPRQIDLGAARIPLLVFGIAYFIAAAVLPLATLLIVALKRSPYTSTLTTLFEPGVLSGESFVTAVTSPTVIKAASNSLIVGVVAALAGTILAFVVAYVSNRTNLPGRSLLEYISMLPLAVPAIVMGLGLLWTWLILPVPIYGTLWVMIVAFVAAQMAQGYRSVSGSILQIDNDLEESAMMHGSSRIGGILRITVPLMRVGLTSTFLLLLMLSMRELTVPLFLFTTDTRLLSIVIFDNFENGVLQASAAISLLYCLVLLILALVTRRFGAADEK